MLRRILGYTAAVVFGGATLLAVAFFVMVCIAATMSYLAFIGLVKSAEAKQWSDALAALGMVFGLPLGYLFGY